MLGCQEKLHLAIIWCIRIPHECSDLNLRVVETPAAPSGGLLHGVLQPSKELVARHLSDPQRRQVRIEDLAINQFELLG